MSEVTEYQQKNIAAQGGNGARSFACPHCQSTEIQRFSVAYQSGISQINAKTAGIGMSLSGKVGIGGAQTKGQSQTELSRTTAPPKKLTYGIWIVCGFVASFFLSFLFNQILPQTLADGLAISGSVGLVLYFMYRSFRFNRDVYPKLMQQWENSWVCFRCGHKFVM